MRRDVAPDPAHVKSIPDYDHLDRYGLYGFEAGRADLQAANELVAELRATKQRSPLPSAVVVAALGLLALLAGLARLIAAAIRRRSRSARASFSR